MLIGTVGNGSKEHFHLKAGNSNQTRIGAVGNSSKKSIVKPRWQNYYSQPRLQDEESNQNHTGAVENSSKNRKETSPSPKSANKHPKYNYATKKSIVSGDNKRKKNFITHRVENDNSIYISSKSIRDVENQNKTKKEHVKTLPKIELKRGKSERTTEKLNLSLNEQFSTPKLEKNRYHKNTYFHHSKNKLYWRFKNVRFNWSQDTLYTWRRNIPSKIRAFTLKIQTTPTLDSQSTSKTNTPMTTYLDNHTAHSLNKRRTPFLNNQRTPSLNNQRTPSLNNQRTPLNNQRTPS